MPPTNYIWMKTNLRNELIGIYEWINGAWHEVEIKHSVSDEIYTKEEVNALLDYTEQLIAQKLANGEYEIGNITIDDELSDASENPVQNKVVAAKFATKADKAEFDALVASLPNVTGIQVGTTAEWTNSSYLPTVGEIIIYSDGGGQGSPRIKIGTGNAYVQDLMFLDQDLSEALNDHITNNVIHVTQEEKDRWNHKIDIDTSELDSGTLIFTRN